MSQAKRRREQLSRVSEAFREMLYENISLHWLSPTLEIDGAYTAKLAVDESLGDFSQVTLQAYRANIGGRVFHVGFALGDGESFSAFGSAVIARLGLETQSGQLHVVPVSHKDIAWNIVLRHLRSFDGQTLLFVSPDPDTYDVSVGEMLKAYTGCKSLTEHCMLRLLTSEAKRLALRMKSQTLLQYWYPRKPNLLRGMLSILGSVWGGRRSTCPPRYPRNARRQDLVRVGSDMYRAMGIDRVEVDSTKSKST